MLIALSIILMVVDKRVDGFARVKSYLSVPAAAVQYVVNVPAMVIDTMTSRVRSHQSLAEENLQLKSERLMLQVQLQRLSALEAENNYLKSLMTSAQKVKGKTLIAELLAVSTEPFVHQVTLDKGRKDGVYDGQPVLDASGVMGQVISAGPITSRVLLINDSRSGVAVQNVRSGIRAAAVGDNYSGRLRLLFVPKTADIQNGDLFLTSGVGDHYQEGYPVGKVVSVIKDPAHQFADIELQPSAQLDTSRQVLLIWYK